MNLRPGSGSELVIFSPLPPARSPVAGQSFAMLRGLAQHRRCTVVTEGGLAGVDLPGDVQHLSLGAYGRRAGDFGAVTHLYHLCGHPDHCYMLPTIAAVPGLVVLHDPSLHALLAAGGDDVEGYATALAAGYGGPGRILAEQYRADRWIDPVMQQDMPMLADIVGPARGVIVSSNYAAAKALASVPDAPVSVIPGLYVPPDPQAVPLAREALGIGAPALLFVSVGSVTADKCLDRVLRALAGIAGELPPFRYVIAGAIGADAPDIPAMANRLGLGAQVVSTGFLPAPLRGDLLASADIVINLRPPRCGKTSANALDALGAGACTVIIDRGPLAEWPDMVAEKLAWGVGLERRLGAALLRLARDPAARRQIGRAAVAMIAASHGADHVIPAYLRAIEAAEVRPGRTWRTPVTWVFAPPATPRPAIGRLWQRNLALPLPTEEIRAIRYGIGDATCLDREWTTRPMSDLVADGIAHEADLILVDVAAEMMVLDIGVKLRRLNRMLRVGGLLIINIARAEDGPRGGLERYGEATKLLEASGFTLRRHFAAADPDLREPEEIPVIEEYCWVVIKTRASFTRTHWLWDV